MELPKLIITYINGLKYYNITIFIYLFIFTFLLILYKFFYEAILKNKNQTIEYNNIYHKKHLDTLLKINTFLNEQIDINTLLNSLNELSYYCNPQILSLIIEVSETHKYNVIYLNSLLLKIKKSINNEISDIEKSKNDPINKNILFFHIRSLNLDVVLISFFVSIITIYVTLIISIAIINIMISDYIYTVRLIIFTFFLLNILFSIIIFSICIYKQPFNKKQIIFYTYIIFTVIFTLITAYFQLSIINILLLFCITMLLFILIIITNKKNS